MMRLLWIVLLAACQPLDDATGELATHGDGKRVYWKMALDDGGVKQAIKLVSWRAGVDKSMPTKIHALRYARHKAQNLQLDVTRVNFNALINLSNVIFSWRYEKSGSPIYTCHLHTVSLGEQRDVIAAGHDTAPFCFVEETAPAAQDGTPDGDYVHLLAQYCVKASGSEGSRFIFLNDKDFACDLSDGYDKSVVLAASCLAKNDKNCLGGTVRTCATETVGFENFIATFKARVDAKMECTDDKNVSVDNCTITYTPKEADATNNSPAASNQPGICPAFAPPPAEAADADAEVVAESDGDE